MHTQATAGFTILTSLKNTPRRGRKLSPSIDVLFFLSPLTQIVRPINAFLVVDVQNDFISGSLNISNCAAQQNGIEVSTKEIF